jgi:hypothetical protein
MEAFFRNVSLHVDLIGLELYPRVGLTYLPIKVKKVNSIKECGDPLYMRFLLIY